MLPVVEALSTLAPVSVDTMRAEVAAAALDAGAALVNDVSGGLADPEMAALVAERRRAVRRHALARAQPRHAVAARTTTTSSPTCVRELTERVEALVAAGVRPDAVVLDPGFGFAKHAEHNWELLRRLDEVVALGHRVRRRHLAQDLPRRSSGARPTTARPPLRARRGHRGHDGARRPARGLVRAGARRRRHGRRPRRRRGPATARSARGERRRARPHPADRGAWPWLPRGLRARAPRGPGVRRRRRARRRPRAGRRERRPRRHGQLRRDRRRRAGPHRGRAARPHRAARRAGRRRTRSAHAGRRRGRPSRCTSRRRPSGCRSATSRWR